MSTLKPYKPRWRPKLPHPKRWQACDAFVQALAARGYLLTNDRGKPQLLPLSDAAYLYMFELWQDGFAAALAPDPRPLP